MLTERRSTVRSITRLLIGGVEIGIDQFLASLKSWEDELAKEMEEQSPAPPQSPQEGDPPIIPAPSSQARLALIGLVFELQDSLHTGVHKLGKLEHVLSQFLRPVLRPVFGSRFLAPSRHQTEMLIRRGEAEVQRWIERGSREDLASRALAQKGLNDVVDTSIEFLATNPELQELVQTQSTGLANEVVEEVRERTVSADTFLESLARSLLRKVPRASLPEPPVDLRVHAASLRPEKKGRGIKQ